MSAPAQRAPRRGDRWSAPRALPATVIGGLLLLVAVLFDAEPLYVPGVAFVLLAALAAAWVRLGARGVRVRRTLEAHRVVEDEPLRVRFDVRAGRLPLPPGRLVDPVLEGGAPLAAGRRGARVRVDVRFARRGRRTLAAPRAELRDPLGLVERSVEATGPGPEEVLVLPAVHPVTSPARGGEGSRTVRRGRPALAAETELDGVRALRDGTPASRIFWPSVARGGEPMERHLVADGDQRPLVLLDPRGAAAEEDLDAAVRATASLVVALARAGGCAVLLPGDRRPAALGPTLAGWAHVHARLAVVSGASRPQLGAAAGRRGPLVYVAARAVARPPGALTHGPAGAPRIVVVPGSVPGRAPAFAVAGCTGYDLAGRRGRPDRGGGAIAAQGAVA